MIIGFIGLGTMGKPMAANLIKAGIDLIVWNRSPKPVDALVEIGAKAANTPKDATNNVDILISMLSDDAVATEILVNSGAIANLKTGAMHINMATISVEFANSLDKIHKDLGHEYIAAPVLGRFNVAEAGQLNILAAGSSAAINKAQFLFDIMGQKTWVFGEKPSQANAVKLAANAMIAAAIGTMGESAALAQSYGVEASDFIEMITSTLFTAPVYKNYGALIADNNYEPAGFKLSLGLKDVRLALAAGEKTNVPMPLSGVLRDNFIDSIAHGEGDLDWAAMAKVSLRRSGQK